jgi:SAM-dependent methyltransferase
MMPKRHAFPAKKEFLNCGTLDFVPRNVAELAREPDAHIPTAQIEFRHAEDLFHTQIENSLPADYYADYLMTATFSDKMQAHQAGQAEKLIHLHGGHPESFMDVGCGDGSFLKHMQSQGVRVLGVEASRAFAAEAREAGFEIIEGYVQSDTQLTSETFDLFASRQVFEHLEDPVDVLTGIRKALNPGAVGLIEVPNGARALSLKRFYEFFPDHIQYYSVNSLVGLATEVGLNVIECTPSFGDDYLELWVRNENSLIPCFESMVRERHRICDSLSAKIKDLANAGTRPVAVWGCGAKTLTILAAMPRESLKNICCVFDSDPHKDGHFVPNSNIPIVAPGRADEFAPKAVIVLALSYRKEIAEAVRLRVPSCQVTLSIDNGGEIIEL